MSIIIENIGQLASFIGSLTVVGSALMWIYEKFIGKPRERKRQKMETERQVKMTELISETNEPLIEAISDLKDFSLWSEQDRKSLHKVADANTIQLGKHESRLDDHNERIIILETRTGNRYTADLRKDKGGKNK